MSGFWETLITSQDVWGSVIGGLVGGGFTYGALRLTFKNDKKKEAPQKLANLTTIFADLADIHSKLNSNVATENVGLKEFQRTAIVNSAKIDKETYQLAFDFIEKMPELYNDREKLTKALLAYGKEIKNRMDHYKLDL